MKQQYGRFGVQALELIIGAPSTNASFHFRIDAHDPKIDRPVYLRSVYGGGVVIAERHRAAAAATATASGEVGASSSPHETDVPSVAPKEEAAEGGHQRVDGNSKKGKKKSGGTSERRSHSRDESLYGPPDPPVEAGFPIAGHFINYNLRRRPVLFVPHATFQMNFYHALIGPTGALPLAATRGAINGFYRAEATAVLSARRGSGKAGV